MLSKIKSGLCHNLWMFFVFDVMPYEHIETFNLMVKARKHRDCKGLEVADRFKGAPRSNDF